MGTDTQQVEELQGEVARLQAVEANLRGFIKQLRCRMSELWVDLMRTRDEAARNEVKR